MQSPQSRFDGNEAPVVDAVVDGLVTHVSRLPSAHSCVSEGHTPAPPSTDAYATQRRGSLSTKHGPCVPSSHLWQFTTTVEVAVVVGVVDALEAAVTVAVEETVEVGVVVVVVVVVVTHLCDSES